MKLRLFALFGSLLTPLLVFAGEAPHPMIGPVAPTVGPDFFHTLLWAFFFLR